ncbi:MAG TPA: glycosyltransferase [Rubrobacteraceae bacterium]|nr:glycosyltransferase [Rubrobacteraceae bacterium]
MSTLSVIIPALNEERHIGALLCDVASQTRRPDEVLIVDAGSADGTIAEARRFPFARLLEEEPPVARGRNLGGRSAVGDVLVFLDADPRMMLRYALMALIFALGKFAWANRIDYGFGDHKTLRGEMAPAPKLKSVEQQVVALMGASSGIGRETALRFAERGAR